MSARSGPAGETQRGDGRPDRPGYFSAGLDGRGPEEDVTLAPCGIRALRLHDGVVQPA